jgi:cell division protein FtsB
MDKVTYRRERPRSEVAGPSIFEYLLNSFVVKIGLLVISLFLFYSIFRSVRIMVEKLEILDQARVEVENLRLKNLQLATVLDNMQSTAYLETEARDRLNFSGQKETVFVIPNNVLEMSRNALNVILDESGSKVEKDNWTVWKELLTNGV